MLFPTKMPKKSFLKGFTQTKVNHEVTALKDLHVYSVPRMALLKCQYVF